MRLSRGHVKRPMGAHCVSSSLRVESSEGQVKRTARWPFFRRRPQPLEASARQYGQRSPKTEWRKCSVPLIRRSCSHPRSLFEPASTRALQFEREFFAAGTHDRSANKHVHTVRLDVIQKALVMGDDNNRPLRMSSSR